MKRNTKKSSGDRIKRVVVNDRRSAGEAIALGLKAGPT